VTETIEKRTFNLLFNQNVASAPSRLCHLDTGAADIRCFRLDGNKLVDPGRPSEMDLQAPDNPWQSGINMGMVVSRKLLPHQP
jgi:hypothetical protein